MISNIKYEIISTGSKGNAVVINDCILIDVGVTFKALKNHYKNFRLVLLTHIHSDHFNPTTIKKLHQERPTLRFACCKWLLKELLDIGINPRNIDLLEVDVKYAYNICTITPVELTHNVPNCGYKIHFGDKKLFYATDTNSLNGIEAKNYELYMIEGNYDEEEIKQRIADKKARGEYSYEWQVIKNHFSIQKATNWILKNANFKSQYIFLHGHEEKEGEILDSRENS